MLFADTDTLFCNTLTSLTKVCRCVMLRFYIWTIRTFCGVCLLCSVRQYVSCVRALCFCVQYSVFVCVFRLKCMLVRSSVVCLFLYSVVYLFVCQPLPLLNVSWWRTANMNFRCIVIVPSSLVMDFLALGKKSESSRSCASTVCIPIIHKITVIW